MGKTLTVGLITDCSELHRIGQAGFVGIFCEIKVNQKIRVFGVPAQYKVTLSIHVA